MYQQIADNKRKSIALILGFIVLTCGLAWLIGYFYDVHWLLPVALIVSLGQSLVSYYFSDQIALAANRAQPISKTDSPELYRLVENLAITAGVPMPKVHVMNDMAINAFATGRDPQHASIAVTRGAMEKLSKPELEGVLAHELSHVKNYDIRVSTIVVVLVGVLTLLSRLFAQSMFYGGNREREERESGNILGIFALVAIILAPIAATLIQLAVSRKREYLADASGALLTRYPDGLADALEKIAGDARPLQTASPSTAHLFFANPLEKFGGSMANLFSTHPPIEDRIRRLRAMD